MHKKPLGGGGAQSASPLGLDRIKICCELLEKMKMVISANHSLYIKTLDKKNFLLEEMPRFMFRKYYSGKCMKGRVVGFGWPLIFYQEEFLSVLLIDGVSLCQILFLTLPGVHAYNQRHFTVVGPDSQCISEQLSGICANIVTLLD